MLLITGLGNPGAKYARNRHNIGCITADEIARHWQFGPWRTKFQSHVAEGEIASVKTLILKPQTFYNDSGRAVNEAMRFYKLVPGDIAVFYDEIDLAPGRVRVKRGGGAAGNNGIRSIIAAVGGEFRRARMGTGHPGHKDLVMNHVLSDFSKTDLAWALPMVKACAEAADLLAAGEDERFQTKVAMLAPAPKADLRAQPDAE